MNALPPSGLSPSRAWAAAAARTPRHNPARAGCPPRRALGTRSSPSLPPLQARHHSALRPPLRGRLRARGRRRCPPAAPRPAEEERPPPWPFPLQPPPPPRGPVAAGHGRVPGASGAAGGGRAAAGKAGAGAVGARGGCPGRAAARRGGADPLRSAPPRPPTGRGAVDVRTAPGGSAALPAAVASSALRAPARPGAAASCTAGPGLPRGWHGGVPATGRSFTCTRPGDLLTRLRDLVPLGLGVSYPSGTVTAGSAWTVNDCSQPGFGPRCRPGAGGPAAPGVGQRRALVPCAALGSQRCARLGPGRQILSRLPRAALEAGMVVSGGPGFPAPVCQPSLPPGGVPAPFWVLPSTALRSQAEVGEGSLRQRDPRGIPKPLRLSSTQVSENWGVLC